MRYLRAILADALLWFAAWADQRATNAELRYSRALNGDEDD